MRLLVIEDNIVVAETVKYCLKKYFAIDIINNGKDGLHFARVTNYDVIVLDLNLPDIHGKEVCQVLRKQGVTTPIVVISAIGDIQSKVDLLTIGADDYILKPFNMHELRARINVALRHGSHKRHVNGKLEIAGLVLDPHERSVTRDGELIELRRKEFDLLEYLMRNQGLTLTRGMILEHVWDRSELLWESVVTVHVKYLRDKIDRPYGSNLIVTVHGIGYKMSATEPAKVYEKSA